MLMKKKVIAAAVAATLGHTVVNAVSVNTDGLGQVLLFPYYTVQGSATTDNFDTLITVVNTTDEVKAVKIRFREAKASHEVLDFNIYMSPKDVWVAAVVPDAGGGAKILTPDTTCTVPAIPAAGVPFRNSEYDPDQNGVNDGAGVGLDRTKEGYFEVIEMGVVNDTDSTPAPAATPTPFVPATWATHVNGAPGDCASLNAAWASGSWKNPPQGFVSGDLNVTAPTGGLFGSVSLINVNEGTDYGYDGVALNDFFVPANKDNDLHRDPGTTLPTLADVDPKVSVVLNGNTVVNSSWGLGNNVDPVSAVLMKTKMMNDYATDPGINAATSFIYTMPTKSFYVPIGQGLVAEAPFTQPFFGFACEDVAYTAWDREEQTEIPITSVDFSPRPPQEIAPSALCFEANVVGINGTDAVSSKTATNELKSEFINGWISADLSAGHNLVDDDGNSYQGLPVIGFSTQRYFNGTLAGNSTLSNYGGLFAHKSMTVISS
jgi:hypothetical protein